MFSTLLINYCTKFTETDSMTNRWRKFDMRVDPCGSELSIGDNCFYYLDHTDGGYSASDANQQIFNIKKPMDRKGRSEWYYKEKAINRFANDLAGFLIENKLSLYDSVMVAIPPSKTRDNPEYDDRIVQVIQRASYIAGVDWLDPFDVVKDSDPAHCGGERSLSFTTSNIVFNGNHSLLRNYNICLIVDDVLTSGSHYVACKNKILELNPRMDVLGVFWALHRPNDAIEDFMNGW